MRLRRSVFWGALSIALPVGLVTAHAAATRAVADGTIAGTVIDRNTRQGLRDAVVVLQCACLPDAREARPDDDGHFRFEGLPAGTFTVQVLVGRADVSRVIVLRGSGKATLTFLVDPQATSAINLAVKAPPRKSVPAARDAGSRDFTAVVETSPTATRSAGIGLVQKEPSNREGYAHIAEGGFLDVEDHPLSTVAADVDTASYANVRRFIEDEVLPPPDAVRVEELINYFPYGYAPPASDRSVAVHWEIATCPWQSGNLLARIGLQTTPVGDADVPRRNLVFLIDVSGSMEDADKLPLLQRALTLLVDQLRGSDSVAIVVYAGAAGVVLPPTRGDKKVAIREAIAELQAGGSTNGADGIRDAYRLARDHFVPQGINRVILATDGDFNVGTTSDGELVRLIERERESGVFLSVLGFGGGNLQDAKMEQLADKGNGNYAYIDSLAEARKVLVEQAGATLATVAKDVKLQVEFNPTKVAAFRLIGYENRQLADEHFDDDGKDAGDMGAGHSMTALYELVPNHAPATKSGRKLRYQGDRSRTSAAASDEWMTVRVRHKAPDGKTSRLQEVVTRGTPGAFSAASVDFRFASAVAQYGMLLRGSEHVGSGVWADVLNVARAARGSDPGGHRRAFIELVRRTKELARGS